MNARTSLRLITTGLLAATLLTACGDDEPDPADTPAGAGDTEGPEEMTSEEPTSEDDSMTTSGPADMTAVIETADTDLGTILVDGEGHTLYLFTNDSPNTSVCEDACLEAWPILEGEPTAGEGVDESLVGSIERSDGTVQVTYAEWPLYYFAQDTAPGDVTGQGVNEVWWVLSPEGEAIMDMPDSGGIDY